MKSSVLITFVCRSSCAILRVSVWVICAGLTFSQEAPVPATPLFPASDWAEVSATYPGVQILSQSFDQPRRIRIYAARIDLQHPGLGVVTTGRHPQWEPGVRETMRETTTAFVCRKRAIDKPVVLALNANFYYPVGNEPAPSVLRGLAVSNGELVSPSEKNRWALVFPSEGPVRMQPTKPDTDLKNVQYALGAYVAIVREGAIFGDNQPGNIAPRSAAGICAEGRYLFLLAIDGRRPGHSLGVTIREAGLIMESLGAHNALNLDGGGSTAFAWLNPHNGDVELLNRPSDRPRLAGLPVPGSSERWNAYHLGIVVADTGEDVP